MKLDLIGEVNKIAVEMQQAVKKLERFWQDGQECFTPDDIKMVSKALSDIGSNAKVIKQYLARASEIADLRYAGTERKTNGGE